MESMAISKFKATCLAALERVRQTGRPLLITRRGQPVAQVVPVPPASDPRRTSFGAMGDGFEIVGDVVGPVGEDDWEAAR